MKKLLIQKELQVGRIRKLARRTLNLRRAQKLAKLRIDAIAAETQELSNQVLKFESEDRRLFVLDERRTQMDRTFVAQIEHPNFAVIFADAPKQTLSSWAKGRRFIVWALDEKKAREKILVRYPERAGFRVSAMNLLLKERS